MKCLTPVWIPSPRHQAEIKVNQAKMDLKIKMGSGKCHMLPTYTGLYRPKNLSTVKQTTEFLENQKLEPRINSTLGEAEGRGRQNSKKMTRRDKPCQGAPV
ncbi:MAG: hypothetical protein WCD79_02240 [Chthoniobacteraceae bacterium]